MMAVSKALIARGALVLLVGLPQGIPAQQNTIPVGVKVEAEGGGKGQGTWVQAANDLTPTELKALESLVTEGIKKQRGVKIVPSSFSGDFIAVVVSGAKLPNGKAGVWYIASSVVILASKKGTDELVTHDVVAESNLASLARTIGSQFANVRLRAALGLLN